MDRAHAFADKVLVVGWLYLGGKPPRARLGRLKGVDARHHVSRMPREPLKPEPGESAKSPKNSKKSKKAKRSE